MLGKMMRGHTHTPSDCRPLTRCWDLQPASLSCMRLAAEQYAPAAQVKMTDQPDAYDFSIRTPVTPARWKLYDKVPACCT